MVERKFRGIAANLASLVRGDRFQIADRASDEFTSAISKAQKKGKTTFKIFSDESVIKAGVRKEVAERRANVAAGFNTLP